MSRPKVPYALTFDQNNAVRPRQSSSLSFFARAGSAGTYCTSMVLTCTSADWSRCRASINV
ncbi:hypothetical protein [Streptomyces microflavus]